MTTYNNTEALALNQVIKILRARQIQKLIANRDSMIIICKIRDLTPYAPYCLARMISRPRIQRIASILTWGIASIAII